MEFKPIPTEYNGYLFRSKLEAQWAVFFDAMGIEYVYEVEGDQNDGLWYLPDFYLLRQKTFVEIKGVMKELDMRKIRNFEIGHSSTPFVVGYENMQFTVRARGVKHFSMLARCPECGNVFFYSDESEEQCPCCEHYWSKNPRILGRGDGTKRDAVFEAAARIAKRAMFDHGQTPKNIQPVKGALLNV